MTIYPVWENYGGGNLAGFKEFCHYFTRHIFTANISLGWQCKMRRFLKEFHQNLTHHIFTQVVIIPDIISQPKVDNMLIWNIKYDSVTCQSKRTFYFSALVSCTIWYLYLLLNDSSVLTSYEFNMPCIFLNF